MPQWAVLLDLVNLGSSSQEFVGVWQGDDNQELVVDGAARTFIGAQGFLQISQINYSIGLDIQTVTATLNGADPTVRALIPGYQMRFRPASIYLTFLDPSTGNLIGSPSRMFKGYVNAAPAVTESEGGTVTVSVDIVSHLRDLTTTPNLYKSAQSREALGDGFRKYGTLVDISDDPWGGR